jgi:hypothetical protein
MQTSVDFSKNALYSLKNIQLLFQFFNRTILNYTGEIIRES